MPTLSINGVAFLCSPNPLHLFFHKLIKDWFFQTCYLSTDDRYTFAGVVSLVYSTKTHTIWKQVCLLFLTLYNSTLFLDFSIIHRWTTRRTSLTRETTPAKVYLSGARYNDLSALANAHVPPFCFAYLTLAYSLRYFKIFFHQNILPPWFKIVYCS
jgi:hypothetical protein